MDFQNLLLCSHWNHLNLFFLNCCIFIIIWWRELILCDLNLGSLLCLFSSWSSVSHWLNRWNKFECYYRLSVFLISFGNRDYNLENILSSILTYNSDGFINSPEKSKANSSSPVTLSSITYSAVSSKSEYIWHYQRLRSQYLNLIYRRTSWDTYNKSMGRYLNRDKLCSRLSWCFALFIKLLLVCLGSWNLGSRNLFMYLSKRGIATQQYTPYFCIKKRWDTFIQHYYYPRRQ